MNEELQSKIALAATALPLVITSCIILLAVQEFFYFSVVGPQYLFLLGSADLLKSALLWLPFNALIHSFSLFAEWRKPSDPAPDLGFWKAVENRKLRRKAQTALAFGSALLIAMMSCLFAALDVTVQAVLAFAGPLTIFAAYATLNFPVIFQNWKAHFTAFTLTVLAAVGAMTGSGAGAAQMHANNLVEFRNSSSDAVRKVHLMRLIDRGVLLRQAGTTRIEFVPWDDVKSLVVDRPVDWRSSNFYQIFNLSPKNPPP